MTEWFSLDKSHPRFFTCCGAIHIKVALLAIILFTVICEVIEAAIYIKSASKELTMMSETIYEIIEYLVTFCLVLSFYKESAYLLLPFIGQLFVVFTIFLIYCCQIIFYVFTPFSKDVDNFFFIQKNNKVGFFERERNLLFVLAILACVTTIVGWCLHVCLVSYQYFEHLYAQKKTKEAAKTPTELVNNNASFPNPNFDNDDDIPVFEKKPAGAQMV